MFYSDDWTIDHGDEHAASVSQDAALIAANCGVLLILSVNHRVIGPAFEPDLIMFNGRGDECEDFIHQRTDDAGFHTNRGKCKTACTDHDTLAGSILLAVKHRVGSRDSVRSTAGPYGVRWQDIR